MPPIYTSVVTILEEIKQEIIAEYHQKGLKASGSFENNIKIVRRGRGGKILLSIPFYSQFISKFKKKKIGRGPGGFPPIDIIRQWILDKGLQPRNIKGQFGRKSGNDLDKMAFLVGRKIAQKGTDIFLRKKDPIDIDRITEDVFDYNLDKIGDRILEELKI